MGYEFFSIFNSHIDCIDTIDEWDDIVVIICI
jgi:hypothetical protein